MKRLPDGSITELPPVKPATAAKEFHDTLLQQTKMTPEDVALLDRCLANYDNV